MAITVLYSATVRQALARHTPWLAARLSSSIEVSCHVQLPKCMLWLLISSIKQLRSASVIQKSTTRRSVICCLSATKSLAVNKICRSPMMAGAAQQSKALAKSCVTVKKTRLTAYSKVNSTAQSGPTCSMNSHPALTLSIHFISRAVPELNLQTRSSSQNCT